MINTEFSTFSVKNKDRNCNILSDFDDYSIKNFIKNNSQNNTSSNNKNDKCSIQNLVITSNNQNSNENNNENDNSKLSEVVKFIFPITNDKTI